MTTIYEILKSDHGKVNRLLKQMLDTEENNTGRRQRLLEELKEELLAHAHAEEKVFYAPLRDNRPLKDMIRDSYSEHSEAEGLIHQLEDLDVASQNWEDTVSELRDLIEHHVHDEENEIFPQAHEIFSEKQAADMAPQFEAQKEEERNLLHRKKRHAA